MSRESSHPSPREGLGGKSDKYRKGCRQRLDPGEEASDVQRRSPLVAFEDRPNPPTRPSHQYETVLDDAGHLPLIVDLAHVCDHRLGLLGPPALSLDGNGIPGDRVRRFGQASGAAREQGPGRIVDDPKPPEFPGADRAPPPPRI